MLPTYGRPLGPGGKGRFSRRRNPRLGSGLGESGMMGAALLIRTRGLHGCGRRPWQAGWVTTNASAARMLDLPPPPPPPPSTSSRSSRRGMVLLPP